MLREFQMKEQQKRSGRVSARCRSRSRARRRPSGGGGRGRANETRVRAHTWRVPFEMSTISLLPPHHDPHGAPLRNVDGFNHQWNLINKRDGASIVVQHVDVANLLPWHWHILEQFVDGMRNIFERAEIDTLVVTKLSVRHVAVVL